MPHWADCAVNLKPAGECDCCNDAPEEGADYLDAVEDEKRPTQVEA